jgi:hypothetical protein
MNGLRSKISFCIQYISLEEAGGPSIFPNPIPVPRGLS